MTEIPKSLKKTSMARLSAVYLAYLAIVLVAVVVPAPYGRYAEAKGVLSLLSGVRLNTRYIMFPFSTQGHRCFLVTLWNFCHLHSSVSCVNAMY